MNLLDGGELILFSGTLTFAFPIAKDYMTYYSHYPGERLHDFLLTLSWTDFLLTLSRTDMLSGYLSISQSAMSRWL